MENLKIGVFLSDCGKVLTKILDFDNIISFLKEIPDVTVVERGTEFWKGSGLQTIVKTIKEQKANRIIVAESLPKLSEIKIVEAAEAAGLNQNFVQVIDLKNHCAWPHRNVPKEATEKAKAMLLASVERAKILEPIHKLEFPALKSVLVIGGGISGIQAAEDLADLGFEVHLIEKAPFLGGIAARAGRFFPTDDCAACIQSPTSDVKTITHTSRKCIYRSGIAAISGLKIHTNSQVIKVEGQPGNYRITLEKKPRYVNETKCISCNLCSEVCPIEVPDEYNANLMNRKAIYAIVPNIYPPTYVIDEQSCKFHECEKCVQVCPTKAVELDQKPEISTINVGAIIVATGFKEYDPSVIKEYHYGEYHDVITNLELARMLDAFGPTGGRIIRPSDGKPARRIVFVQCVGSRDKRWNDYCSSICCMISLKHAIMIKTVFPEIDVSICYIDIRTTGREHEEYYEKARELGVKFIKGRPTEISHDPESNVLIVDVEDSLLRRFLELETDLVILATAMVPSEDTQTLAEILKIDIDKDGFFKEYNAKLRPTETKMRGIFLCGGATFPKDAPSSSLQAHSAALKAVKFLNTGKIVKDQRTAVVNEEYCGDCEFCPVSCPYNAIELVKIDEKHVVAKVSDLLCEGCGICIGTCPLNAIDLRHFKQSELLSQTKAILSINGQDKPLILAFCCSECGGASVDSAGMTMSNYPTNVRIVKVPCTGYLRIEHFLTAIKNGAQGVMVVGCMSDGCHHEEGIKMVEKRIDAAKTLLKEYGIEPERVELFNTIFVEGDKFAEAACAMTGRLEKLGPLRFSKEV
ncbi:MAG: hydrogenase iron-sulfur subunit [Candidatus Bathyarchaeia archaeon]|nr:hydrogenase iron-sulfur subunit [Candidatus Bathyarchaeota archaeon]